MPTPEEEALLDAEAAAITIIAEQEIRQDERRQYFKRKALNKRFAKYRKKK